MALEEQRTAIRPAVVGFATFFAGGAVLTALFVIVGRGVPSDMLTPVIAISAIGLIAASGYAAHRASAIRDQAEARAEESESSPTASSRLLSPAEASAAPLDGSIEITSIGFAQGRGQLVAEAVGKACQSVTCERCRHAYAGERVMSAYHSVFGGDTPDKRAAARAGAEALLRKRLAAAGPVIVCPECGWMQKAQIEEVRRYRSTMAASFIGLAAVIIPLIVLGLEVKFDRRVTRITGYTALGSVIVGAAASLVAFVIVKAWDPNRKLRSRPLPRQRVG